MKIILTFCLCTIDNHLLPLQNVHHGPAIGAGLLHSKVKIMETRVYKSKSNGWSAISEIDLGDNRVLTINTCKRIGGRLVSHASVAKREGSFLQHVIFQDYSAWVAIGGNRSTEKAVSELHSSVDFEAVIKAASAHYEGGR